MIKFFRNPYEVLICRESNPIIKSLKNLKIIYYLGGGHVAGGANCTHFTCCLAR